jgi:predicted TIM-barrel fold metal-dependent hydrolase
MKTSQLYTSKIGMDKYLSLFEFNRITRPATNFVMQITDFISLMYYFALSHPSLHLKQIRTMNTTNTIPSDSPQKITVESQVVYVLWQQGRAYAGFEAYFEVKTLLVGEGAKAKATLRTTKGKKLGKVKGVITLNRWRGKVLIPENVKPDDYVYLEVELPRHGLEFDSNEIPVRPPIEVSSMRWSKPEVGRDEEVTLTCNFTNGIENNDGVNVIVYEYDNNGNHDKVVTIPATIQNMKVELKWKFIYQEDTGDIPTEEQLQKYGKNYSPPEYFFVVMVDTVPVGSRQESGLLRFADTSDITVQHGIAAAGEAPDYTITFADGSSVTEKADADNRILITDAPPGPFTILPEKRPATDTVKGKTGTPLIAVFPDASLLVDGHMHIQSNNCCPLPLQWAILAEKAGFLVGRPESTRKSLNMTTAGLVGWVFARRLGTIGRLSTDMISRLYAEKLYDNDMRHELSWTVLSDRDMVKYKNNQEKMRIIAGRKAKLSALTKSSSEHYDEEFVANTRYYFEGNRIRRMGIALLMDLSFAGYWSRYGIPLYLSTDTGMLYLNDFTAVNIRQERRSNTVRIHLAESVVTPEIDLAPDLGKREPPSDIRSRLHLFPSFADGEVPGPGQNFYTEQFDRFADGERGSTTTVPLIRFQSTETGRMRDTLSRKKIHFVAPAPGEDSFRFEDYAVQRERSIAAAIMQPLSLFLFYHYDPRRHCLTGGSTARTIAEAILNEHAFFTAAENTQHVVTVNNVRYSGGIDAAEHARLNDPKNLADMLAEQLRGNADVLAELHLHDTGGSGLFWGVKMYPRLGYSPSDFGRYPQLEQFYAACAEKSIPITVHCGPGGMSIADYHLYERYDEGRFLDSGGRKRYDLKHAADRFDGVAGGATGRDSPSRWEEVLSRHSKLKLNLAHFGSSDTWKKCAGFGKMDEELDKRAKRTAKESKYDKYDLYRDWTKKTAELVQNYDNVYTDISFFVNDDPSWFFGLGHDRDDVAEDLVYLLEKYPDLRDRLLMGSDWYMIEKEGEEGIGDYLRKMFYMLRSVSQQTGFDTWHQFSVVNHLRFLGLIEEKKGSTGPFKVDMDKVKGLRGKFEERMGKRGWKKENGCTITTDDFNKSLKEMFDLLESITIQSGENILRGAQLAILPPK